MFCDVSKVSKLPSKTRNVRSEFGPKPSQGKSRLRVGGASLPVDTLRSAYYFVRRFGAICDRNRWFEIANATRGNSNGAVVAEEKFVFKGKNANFVAEASSEKKKADVAYNFGASSSTLALTRMQWFMNRIAKKKKKQAGWLISEIKARLCGTISVCPFRGKQVFTTTNFFACPINFVVVGFNHA